MEPGAGSPSRPHDSLLAGGDFANPSVDELLETLPLVRLRRVDVPLRIGRDAVDGVELAGLPSAVAKGGELLECVAAKHANLHVPAVRHVEIRLPCVFRERHIPYGALGEALLPEERLL